MVVVIVKRETNQSQFYVMEISAKGETFVINKLQIDGAAEARWAGCAVSGHGRNMPDQPNTSV